MPTQLNQVPEALQSDFDIVGDSGFFADPQQLFLDSLVKDPHAIDPLVGGAAVPSVLDNVVNDSD